jgi:hypothetical protein
MDQQKALREHVLELLEGKSAHIDLESSLKKFPTKEINTRPENSPHTAWELLEHIRLAQWDILEFSQNAKHVSPDWPDGYWPKDEGTEDGWQKSLQRTLDDLQAIRDLVADETNDLYMIFPWGDGQTLLREALRIADHNAYHLGQIVLLKKMLD